MNHALRLHLRLALHLGSDKKEPKDKPTPPDQTSTPIKEPDTPIPQKLPGKNKKIKKKV